MARFHPDSGLLSGYAAGTLAAAPALVVATHLDHCPECREAVRPLLAVGGKILADCAPAPVSSRCRDRVLAACSGAPKKSPDHGGIDLSGWPRPLRGYLQNVDGINWRNRGAGIRARRLPCPAPDWQVQLLDVEPGRNIPVHSHRGEELVVVLKGTVWEDDTPYHTGDFIYGDSGTLHVQRSDPKAGCLCLVALRGQVDFKGRLGPVLNLVNRIQGML